MPPASSQRWIISRRADLACLILSPWLSVAAVGLYLILTDGLQKDVGRTARLFYFVFTVFFDHPHILQTFSRTHVDPVERKRHFFTHHWLLGLALLGTFLWPGTVGTYWFEAFFDTFGTWHIYAQNAGFLKVYGRLDSTSPFDRKLGRAYFNLLFNAYLVRVLVIDLGRTVDDFGWGGPEILAVLKVLRWVLIGAALGTGMAVVGRLTWTASRGRFQWSPRLLFLGSLTAVYGMNYWAVGVMPVAVMLVFDTLYHDVQYLRWIAHYQRHQNPAKGYALKWLVASVALAFVFFYGDRWTGSLFGRSLPISSLFLTLTLYHYYVDGVVWKFGKQPELRPLLQANWQMVESPTSSFRIRSGVNGKGDTEISTVTAETASKR